MKKLILMFLSIVVIHTYGQNIDYNKIILPDYVKDADFGEKLVQLAWRNHPTNEVFRREVTRAKLDKKRYSSDWLNAINLQSNINEFTLDGSTNANGESRADFYPKYNIRTSINVGAFFSIPYDTKRAKEQIVIVESQLNAQKLFIRATVLKAYNDFLLREKSYKIQSQMLSDTENSHKLMEQKFKNGEITFEQYIVSQNSYNSITINILEAEHDYKNAKLDLEQLIGMKLEDVR